MGNVDILPNKWIKFQLPATEQKYRNLYP